MEWKVLHNQDTRRATLMSSINLLNFVNLVHAIFKLSSLGIRKTHRICSYIDSLRKLCKKMSNPMGLSDAPPGLQPLRQAIDW